MSRLGFFWANGVGDTPPQVNAALHFVDCINRRLQVPAGDGGELARALSPLEAAAYGAAVDLLHRYFLGEPDFGKTVAAGSA